MGDNILLTMKKMEEAMLEEHPVLPMLCKVLVQHAEVLIKEWKLEKIERLKYYCNEEWLERQDYDYLSLLESFTEDLNMVD